LGTVNRATDAAVLPREHDKASVVEAMFDRIAPRYDALNRVLTFRLDVRWRRTALASLGIPTGARVLDLACGTGDFCRAISAEHGDAVGVDFALGMLRAARTDAPLVRADALRLPFAASSFDAITCGFALRNLTSLPPAFAECARVLRPGGRVALLEVAEPTSPLPHALHAAWFRRVVPFVGGLVSDRDAYRYLPASTSYLPSVPVVCDLLAVAGIVGVSQRTLGFGAAQLFTGTRA
jgi:demethylmenaquinone methyltransferase / 2-methoxy-6-polyprenyl-1,4-benzoquinol methylase